MRDYRTIVVGARTQYVVKVSPEDYDFLMQWKWTYAVSHPRHGGLVYARRSIRVGDSNVTILMHRVIIIERMGLVRPSEKHFVDHENGDALGASTIAAVHNFVGSPTRKTWRTGAASIRCRYRRRAAYRKFPIEGC